MAGPDVIFIGFPKTGSGWLYNALKKHKDVSITNAKEISYFSILNNPEVYSSEFKYWNTPHWNARQRKNFFKNRIKSYFTGNYQMSLSKSISWDFKYLFGQKNDDWYLSLFNSKKINLEVYAAMPEDQVAKLFQLCPKAKIVFVLRNPLDRFWSQFKMYLYRNQLSDNLENIDYEIFDKYFTSDNINRFNPELIIKKWTKYYPQEQFYYTYFESFIQEREKFLINVFDFINIDKSNIKEIIKNNNQARNKTKSKVFPKRVQYKLASLLENQFKDCLNLKGPYPIKWDEECQNILAKEKGNFNESK